MTKKTDGALWNYSHMKEYCFSLGRCYGRLIFMHMKIYCITIHCHLIDISMFATVVDVLYQQDCLHSNSSEFLTIIFRLFSRHNELLLSCMKLDSFLQT